jgi:hypothetical protein
MKTILGIILLMLPPTAFFIYLNSLVVLRVALEVIGGVLVVGAVFFCCLRGAFYLLDINLDKNP